MSDTLWIEMIEPINQFDEVYRRPWVAARKDGAATQALNDRTAHAVLMIAHSNRGLEYQPTA